jgi:hypothetical protein
VRNTGNQTKSEVRLRSGTRQQGTKASRLRQRRQHFVIPPKSRFEALKRNVFGPPSSTAQLRIYPVYPGTTSSTFKPSLTSARRLLVSCLQAVTNPIHLPRSSQSCALGASTDTSNAKLPISSFNPLSCRRQWFESRIPLRGASGRECKPFPPSGDFHPPSQPPIQEAGHRWPSVR